MSALIALGRHVAASGPPTGAVRELLELHVIDTAGAWIAGARTGEGAALIGLRAATRARGQADIALDLATRCALARLSEIDDIDLASMTTPGAIVIPGALTLASTMPAAAGDDVMAAMLAGYEIMTRLGRAIDGPRVLYRGIWPTYFAAPMGIAAVAARLLGLDDEAAAHALALALTLAAPGVGHHNAPTTARWLAVGNAARNGLAAALAAQAGFTADLKLLEGRFLPEIYDITPDLAALTRGLGQRDVLADVSFKPWCAARQTMAATQALKEIVQSSVAVADIVAIEVGVVPPHHKMIDHDVTLGDRASHLTSLQYQMASAVLDSAATCDVGRFAVPRAVRAVMNRIKVTADENLLARYPKVWPARVLAVTQAGAIHERTVEHVPGDAARAFGLLEVRAKFRHFVALVLGDEMAGQLAELALAAVDDGGSARLLMETVEQG